jgi:hypothetical protein
MLQYGNNSVLWGASFLSYVGYCSLRSCWLGRVERRESFAWPGMTPGRVVVSRLRGFCVGGLRINPGVGVGGELLCEVWFFPLQKFLTGIAYKIAVSRGENIQLGCLYRRMRRCVSIAALLCITTGCTMHRH